MEPTADKHVTPVEDSYMVVHMAGFDLRRDEHRATPSAVLEEKFGLARNTIVNVSPIGYQLQELHIMSSKLPSLKSAIARTGGKLRLTTTLDARMPPDGSIDPEVIESSSRSFEERINREIARLSVARSRKLRDLADFLTLYRDENQRVSVPRPRRTSLYASAFLDEAVFPTSVLVEI